MCSSRVPSDAETTSPEIGVVVDRLLALRPDVRRMLSSTLPVTARADLRGATRHQLAALQQLPPGGLTMREFSRAVGVSSAAATTLANRLVDRELVERRPDPDDRRRVWIVPSLRAQAMLREHHAWERRMAADAIARLSPEQFNTLADIVASLTAETSPATLPARQPVVLPPPALRVVAPRPESAAAPPPDRDELTERWAEAALTIFHDFVRETAAVPRARNLTVLELDAITQLPVDGLPLSDLARMLALADSEAHELVTTLRHKRLVGWRRPAGSSGSPRVVRTPEAEALLEERARSRREALGAVLHRLPPEKLAGALELAAVLVGGAPDAPGAPAPSADQVRTPSAGCPPRGMARGAAPLSCHRADPNRRSMGRAAAGWRRWRRGSPPGRGETTRPPPR